MTTVTYRDYYGKNLIIAEGHSNSAPKGQDLVCAGISCLVYTLLNTLADEEASSRIKFVRNIVRDGYVCLEFEIFDFARDRVKGIVDGFMTGLYMLSESYPQNVKIE